MVVCIWSPTLAPVSDTSDVRVLAAHDEMLRLYKQKAGRLVCFCVCFAWIRQLNTLNGRLVHADAVDVTQLKRKADASEVQQLVKLVADLQVELQRKANLADVIALQSHQSELKRQLDSKAEASDVKAIQIQAAEATLHHQSIPTSQLKSPPRAKRAVGRGIVAKSSSSDASLSPPRAVLTQPQTLSVQGRWVRCVNSS